MWKAGHIMSCEMNESNVSALVPCCFGGLRVIAQVVLWC